MKIFKLFVCSLLILSVSLINSLAAISVSDGSAFVTKAEFAADLNNLSNRMSSLENSLDAKIDSLVSSYLSRNGIWNGEKQTHILTLDTKVEFKIGSTMDYSTKVIANDSNGYCTSLIFGTDSVKANGTTKGHKREEQTTAYHKFCVPMSYHFMKTTKSGLLTFMIEFVGSSSAYNEIGFNITKWTPYDSYWSGITGISSLVLLRGDELNSNNANSQWVASWSSAYSSGNVLNGTNLTIQYMSFPYSKINLFGFVNKGDELSMAFNVSGYSAYYATSKWTPFSEGGYIIKSLSAEIY